MTKSCSHKARYQTLAARWRVLGLMALAIARACLPQQNSRVSQPSYQLGMLETWLRFALCQLPQEIAQTCRAGEPANEAEQEALYRLYTLLRALAQILLIVQMLKARPSGLPIQAQQLCADADAADLGLCANAGKMPPYIDPG